MHVYSTLRNGLKSGEEGYLIVLSRTMTMVSNGCTYVLYCMSNIHSYVHNSYTLLHLKIVYLATLSLDILAS